MKRRVNCPKYLNVVRIIDRVKYAFSKLRRSQNSFYIIARAIAPCFLLLDDIDIMLGTNEDDNEDEPYSTPLENDVSKLTINESNRSHSPDLPIDRYRNKRTSSLAFDRLLSTLLVEIDGIGISSKIRDNLSNFEVSQSSTKCDAIALYKEKLVPQNKHGKEVQHAASKSLPDHRQVIVIATASRARHLDRYIDS